MDPLHVAGLAGDALDEVRRRVQNEIVDHRRRAKYEQKARSAKISLKRARAAIRILWRIQLLFGWRATSGFKASLINDATVAEIVASLFTALSYTSAAVTTGRRTSILQTAPASRGRSRGRPR